MLEFVELNPVERSRTYHFPVDGELVQFSIANVARLAVSSRGTHRLEDTEGNKYIVPTGWVAIEVDVDSWSL